MTSYESSFMVSREEAAYLLAAEILDIHEVATLLGIKRSSVNTLRVRRAAKFPKPIYESAGEGRHPVRLWWREDVVAWIERRPNGH